MNNLALPITGGCLCGNVRFEISAKPLEVYFCHCTKCQRLSGAPVTVGVTFPIEALTFETGELTCYQSSQNYERLSCNNCGSLIGGRHSGDNARLASLRVGCMDNPNDFEPEMHVFTATRIHWYEITDDLPRHADVAPDMKKLWKNLWT